MTMIIAIDGPSGAGKSTLGRMIAREFGLLYIDTGAMYRAAGLAVTRSGISTLDAAAVARVVSNSEITLEGDPDSLQVLLDGHDVSDEIRTEEATHTASLVSAISEVRRALVARQRALSAHGRGAVLDGRDIGTIVFPNADVKFFLTAQPVERANRRYEEERLRERDLTFEDTLEDINKRDQRDSTREDSPLVIADDAIVIDSTELTIDDVFERMTTEIRDRKAKTQIDADKR